MGGTSFPLLFRRSAEGGVWGTGLSSSVLSKGRLCNDPFPATFFFQLQIILSAQHAFSRHGGIYRSDVGQNKNQILGAGTDRLPMVGPVGPRQKNASGGPRPSHRPR